MLTRRAFFQSLVASVVAAGMPLPVGFPQGEVRRMGGIQQWVAVNHDLADLSDIIYNIEPTNTPFLSQVFAHNPKSPVTWSNAADLYSRLTSGNE